MSKMPKSIRSIGGCLSCEWCSASYIFAEDVEEELADEIAERWKEAGTLRAENARLRAVVDAAVPCIEGFDKGQGFEGWAAELYRLQCAVHAYQAKDANDG